MKSSHALVLFSTAENAPCVISEALCCGLPVISNRLAGIPEMLMHGENGVLIEDRIEALVMAIDALIHHYGFNRDYIAKAAHRNYAPKFAVQELIESYQVEIHGGVSECVELLVFSGVGIWLFQIQMWLIWWQGWIPQ